MPFLRHLVPALLLGAVACPAAEPTKATPWTETITMTIKDKPRAFVVTEGTSWMVMSPEDLADPLFLLGKDVMLPGKFERTDGQRAWFFGLDRFVAEGRADHWATRLEGDNLYVLGRVTEAAPGRTVLLVSAVHAAESDAQIIAARLSTVKLEDYAGRLTVAAWVREHGATMGNKDYWISAADTIVAQVVDAAAAEAASRKDAALVLQAVRWAIEQNRDAGLAGRAASQPWLYEAGGEVAEQVSRTMQGQGFAWYRERWHPKTQALTLEFEDRFAAIPWKDAEGFYKLGRWAESHADDLPAARDLSYRCYQAGFRGDPTHNGIRRKLGLDAVGTGGTAAGGETSANGAFQHGASGTVVNGPDGWKRAASAIDGDATWVDPASDTAYISVRGLAGAEAANDFDELWNRTMSTWTVREGYTAQPAETVELPGAAARRIRFTYQEGRYARFAEVAVVRRPSGGAAMVLISAFTETEQAKVASAMTQVMSQVNIPTASPGN